VRVARAMATVMRVAGDKVAMATAANSIQWRGWQAIDGKKGDGDGDGEDVGDVDGDEAGRQRRGQG
jgi:hypothetical protein